MDRTNDQYMCVSEYTFKLTRQRHAFWHFSPGWGASRGMMAWAATGCVDLHWLYTVGCVRWLEVDDDRVGCCGTAEELQGPPLIAFAAGI